MTSAGGDAAKTTELEFRTRADAVLASVESIIDEWLRDDVADIDGRRSGGVLELTFEDRSRIVVNTQPPLRELWLAARSGGHHFRCVGERWLDRDGSDFFDVLSACASLHAGVALRFAPPR